jgi:phosphatidylinositol phospholipase C gamma-1
MSSFPESKVDKWLTSPYCRFFLKYHRLQFSRVYPKGARLDSSNYDPIKMWNSGVQMTALNYQTGDRAMQLNQGKFLQNGKCGYVLRPEFMMRDDFDPYENKPLEGVEPLTLNIRIIAGRHLMKTGRGIMSPFVELEVVGIDYDCRKCKTSTVRDNGLNPVWKENFIFDVENPDLAILRFVVNDEDMFGDPVFLGQTCFPVKCLRQGYRSVPLKNEYSEDLELAALLVHLDIKNARDNEAIYTSIQELRNSSRHFRRLIEEAESEADSSKLQTYRSQLQIIEEQLHIKDEERRQTALTARLRNTSLQDS